MTYGRKMQTCYCLSGGLDIKIHSTKSLWSVGLWKWDISDAASASWAWSSKQISLRSSQSAVLFLYMSRKIHRNLHFGRYFSEQLDGSKLMSLCHCLEHLIVSARQGLVKIGLKLIWTSGENRFPKCNTEQYGVVIFSIVTSRDLAAAK